MPAAAAAIQIIAQSAFLLLVTAAAVWDVATLRIPNALVVALAASFVPAALAGGISAPTLAVHLGLAVLMLAAGALLMMRGLWGGGDAKLAAALVLWAGWQGLPALLMATALAGGGLAVVVLLARCLPILKRSGSSSQPRDKAATIPLPYGVALAAGGLWWAVRAPSFALLWGNLLHPLGF